MKTSICVTSLLVAAAFCPSLCSARRDDLTDYTVYQLGVTTTLWCNESVQYKENIGNDWPNGTLPESWMLPNLTIIYVSTDRFEITDSKWALTVNNITINDLGQYHCMLRANDTWLLARLGLNAQGPYFEDLWNKYELNTIIGLSSGFGFLALAIATMLVYHFRYISPLDEDDVVKQNTATSMFGAGTMSEMSEPNGAGTFNKAYDGDLPAESEPSTSDNSDHAEQEDGTAL